MRTKLIDNLLMISRVLRDLNNELEEGQTYKISGPEDPCLGCYMLAIKNKQEMEILVAYMHIGTRTCICMS